MRFVLITAFTFLIALPALAGAEQAQKRPPEHPTLKPLREWFACVKKDVETQITAKAEVETIEEIVADGFAACPAGEKAYADSLVTYYPKWYDNDRAKKVKDMHDGMTESLVRDFTKFVKNR